jgi:hypothetical protein
MERDARALSADSKGWCEIAMQWLLRRNHPSKSFAFPASLADHVVRMKVELCR